VFGGNAAGVQRQASPHGVGAAAKRVQNGQGRGHGGSLIRQTRAKPWRMCQDQCPLISGHGDLP